MSIIPQFLKENDQVLIVAPAGMVTQHQIEYAVKQLKINSLKAVLGQHIYKKHFKYAGTDQERLADLQWALDHSEAKAIWCARGGYGCNRILGQLDWTNFQKKPKWLIGFSDITVLHAHINNLQIASMHGPVAQQAIELTDSSKQLFFSSLFGRHKELNFDASDFDRTGIASGKMVGGNLSLIAHLCGQLPKAFFEGKILFIEEVGEYLYHIDRMMIQLKNNGILDQVSAVLVGHFSYLREKKKDFGKNYLEIIREHIPKSIPLAFGINAGHEPENDTLFLGIDAQLSVTKEKCQLRFIE